MDPDRTQIGRSEMNPAPLLLNPSRCKEEPSPSQAPRTSALARWLAEPEQVPYAVENRNDFFIISRPSRVASHDLNMQGATTVRFKTTPSIRRRRPGIGAGQSLFWGGRQTPQDLAAGP